MPDRVLQPWATPGPKHVYHHATIFGCAVKAIRTLPALSCQANGASSRCTPALSNVIINPSPRGRYCVSKSVSTPASTPVGHTLAGTGWRRAGESHSAAASVSLRRAPTEERTGRAMATTGDADSAAPAENLRLRRCGNARVIRITRHGERRSVEPHGGQENHAVHLRSRILSEGAFRDPEPDASRREPALRGG